MSYISGFMIGTAIARGLREMVGAQGGMQALPFSGGGFSSGRGRSGSDSISSVLTQLFSETGNGGRASGIARQSPKAERGGLLLVSAQSGRRRYRIRSGNRAMGISAALADLLEKKLCQVEYIDSVKVNAVTGSLLITYDESAADRLDRLMELLRDRVLFPGVPVPVPGAERPSGQVGQGKGRMAGSGQGKGQDAWTRGEAGAMPLEAHAGDITRSIRGSVRDLSAWIKDHTNGWFDVSSLAALLFLMRGMRKIIVDRTSPSGSQMLWWGISLLRGWRTI